MPDRLIALYAEYSVEDPWGVPAGCARATLLRAADAGAPRLATSCAVYFDDEMLTFVFEGRDAGVVATYLDHDAPLWKEDVVEVFLAPGTLTEYFEIEVSPLGTAFDARIESPDGVRSTMKTDLGWTCDGLFAAVRRTPESFDAVVRIPFAALGAAAPAGGESWRVNLFRIDRDGSCDEFLAWQPTLKTPPDFHVTAAFGTLEFRRSPAR